MTDTPWPTVAHVGLIRLFPLKSGAEQNPGSALLGPGGVAGDRAWAVADADGEVLRPRHHPDLVRLSLGARPSSAAGAAVPQILLDGDAGWGRREGGGATDLADLLGVPGAHLVALGPAGDASGAAPRAALHLVGADAVRDPDAPPGADPGRRANLVLTGARPGAERAWVGARLRVGAAGPSVLEVTAVPRRCLGVYAAVLVPGEVAMGDVVALGPPAGTGGGR